MPLPRVASIQDMSGVGRCSLTAAIPILSAMGAQVCPLPTAVLSNQTAFDSYTATSLTDHLACSISEWKKQGLRFDAVTTGFLMDARQASLAGDFIGYAKAMGALIVIDPVMGDEGSLYPVFDQSMVNAFISLVRDADVITPNLTEACLLADIQYPGSDLPGEQRIAEIARPIAQRLCSLGPHTVIITGIHSGEYVYNVSYQARTDEMSCTGSPRIGGSFSGTGDIFSSIVCGALLRGESIDRALRLARILFEHAITLSVSENTDPREGIAFERFLHILCPQ